MRKLAFFCFFCAVLAMLAASCAQFASDGGPAALGRTDIPGGLVLEVVRGGECAPSAREGAGSEVRCPLMAVLYRQDLAGGKVESVDEAGLEDTVFDGKIAAVESAGGAWASRHEISSADRYPHREMCPRKEIETGYAPVVWNEANGVYGGVLGILECNPAYYGVEGLAYSSFHFIWVRDGKIRSRRWLGMELGVESGLYDDMPEFGLRPDGSVSLLVPMAAPGPRPPALPVSKPKPAAKAKSAIQIRP
jgi:hypothetical protein